MIQADTETGKSVLNKLATQVIEYISLKFHIGVPFLSPVRKYTDQCFW